MSAATKWIKKWGRKKSAVWWDERTPHIECYATGSHREPERLWRTEHGQWVLESWIWLEGEAGMGFAEIAEHRAAQWWIRNEIDHPLLVGRGYCTFPGEV